MENGKFSRRESKSVQTSIIAIMFSQINLVDRLKKVHNALISSTYCMAQAFNEVFVRFRSVFVC